MVMLEKFKEAIDKGNGFGTFLTDLVKAFDCMNHKPLMAKRYCHGVSPEAVKTISF